MTSTSDPLSVRPAVAADAPAIAALHAASWRAHYRGALSDAYLDGPVEEERRRVWTDRLGTPGDAMMVILAEAAGGLLGFVCAFPDRDAEFGTLIDNLHVRADHKGNGIGRELMRQAGARLLDAAPDRPVHLFVKQDNVGARAFYERIGGREAGQDDHTGPDGSVSPVLRILWMSPAALVERTNRS